jgi:hypothetical protein
MVMGTKMSLRYKNYSNGLVRIRIPYLLLKTKNHRM